MMTDPEKIAAGLSEVQLAQQHRAILSACHEWIEAWFAYNGGSTKYKARAILEKQNAPD
jgi:hypothetical protein